MRIYISTLIFLSLLSYTKLNYAEIYNDTNLIAHIFINSKPFRLTTQAKFLEKYHDPQGEIGTNQAKLDSIEKKLHAFETFKNEGVFTNVSENTNHNSNLEHAHNKLISEKKQVEAKIKSLQSEECRILQVDLLSDPMDLYDKNSTTQNNTKSMMLNPCIGKVTLYAIAILKNGLYNCVDLKEKSSVDNPDSSDDKITNTSDLLEGVNKTKILDTLNRLKDAQLNKAISNRHITLSGLLGNSIATDDERLRPTGNFITKTAFYEKVIDMIDSGKTKEEIDNTFTGVKLITNIGEFNNNPDNGTKQYPEGYLIDKTLCEAHVDELFGAEKKQNEQGKKPQASESKQKKQPLILAKSNNSNSK
jgi:hypothetical protein